MLQLQKKAQQLIKHIAIILAFLLMLSSPVAAQDYDKGLAAYINEDYATAFKEWKPLADQGLAIAQLNLGVMYTNGWGVIQDYKEAVKWFKLAAEQEDAKAQHSLGVMYTNGWGIIQDYKEAVKWYKLAAEQGYAKAQSNLGLMYVLGQGVIQDYAMAHLWLNIGATNGDELGGTNRDVIAEEMTSAAIEKAQAMARKCMESNYEECGY